MRRTSGTTRRRLIAAAGALAMGFGGLAPQAQAQAMTEVTFIVVNNLFSTPAFVAVENGYWTKQGLNVKIKLTSSGRQVTQSLQAGEAQFGHAALSTTTASASSGPTPSSSAAARKASSPTSSVWSHTRTGSARITI